MINKNSIQSNIIYACSILVALLGCIVIIGWYSQNETLIQVLPEFVPMQYNTALCFLLCGIILYILPSFRKEVGLILSSIVAVIGFLTLLEYVGDINIGLDELFMKHYIIIETSHPGRMAPNTALCFFLSGIAFLLFPGTIFQSRISGITGSIVFGLAAVAFIGYLTGIETAYGTGDYTRMAVHTAFGFMLLGTGISLINWQKEKKHFSDNTEQIQLGLEGYITAILAAILFFFDISMPLGVAAGVPYVLIVLLAWFRKHRLEILLLAIVASLLVFVGFLLSPGGVDSWMVIMNRSLALITIWLAAGLLYNIKGKDSRLMEVREDLKSANELLAKRNLELSKSNEELEQFAYIASHDLQEPLRKISSFGELLKDSSGSTLSEAGTEYLGYMLGGAERMKTLIEDLLEYSRIGRQESNKIPVDLNKAIVRVMEVLEISIKENRAQIISDSLPTVLADRMRIQQVFQNLIGNSLKYRKVDTPPVIKISSHKLDDECVEIIIKDNGIGFDDKFSDRIFLPFQRLHSKTNYSGSGIGLAICKKIITQYNGTISATGTLGVGASFSIRLPLHILQPEQITITSKNRIDETIA